MKRTLAEIHPELVSEWSEKNVPLSPKQITYGSNKRVWWRGCCGHEWQAPVKARSQGENCPYCAGKRVLSGFNDLETVSPALAREWSEKNEGLSPQQVTAGSNRRVWWKGKCGHEWQAVVKNRVNGAGCPYCSRRRVLPGGNDLAETNPALAEEWSERNEPLKPSDVMAFSNRNVWWTCRTCGNEWNSRIADRTSGSRCPYCSGRRLKAGTNDLATTHPQLAAEWAVRNAPLTASQVNAFSRQTIWWKCQTCGHEWKAGIHRRVQGSPCPVCAGRVVKQGKNDLATTDPELCEQWDQERNGELRPSMVQRHSRKTVWWKGTCGHRWRAAIAVSALEGQGCPQCQNEYRQALPFLMILYYAWTQGLSIRIRDTTQIGLPLDFYFPEIQGAILFSKGSPRSGEDRERDQVTGFLCGMRQIRLVRIEKEGDVTASFSDRIAIRGERFEDLATAVRKAYRLLGVHVEIRPEQDQEILRECYRRWKEGPSMFQ